MHNDKKIDGSEDHDLAHSDLGMNSSKTLQDYQTHVFCDSPTIQGNANLHENTRKQDDLQQDKQKIFLQASNLDLKSARLSDYKDSNERTDQEEEEEDQANTPKLLSIAGLGNDKSFKFINTTTQDHNYFIDTNKNNSFDFRSKVSRIYQNAEAAAPSNTVN